MNNKKRNNVIWLSILILTMCAVLTTIVVAGILNGFVPDVSDAIEINSNISLEDKKTQNDSAESGSVSDSIKASTSDEGSLESEKSSAETFEERESISSKRTTNPGFQIEDNETVWNTETQVEIFRISYENGNQIITANSENGEKVIAPGTENSYSFKLKNTGDVALEYSLDVDAYFSSEDITIPITARISRYDGKWILGNENEFADVSALDSAEDKANLGSGKYTYYTLDWVWPFEGNDELDTMLGNLAYDEDISFTIVISTVAKETTDGGGIDIPQTGDDSNVLLWIILAILALAFLIFLAFSKRGQRGVF